MINKNLVFLSYGRHLEYFRTIFSILSFIAWDEYKGENTRIIVYTDQPEFFLNHLPDLKIEYFLLTSELLHEMLADTDFIHRRKVAVIDMTFKNFPDEDLVFVDSDTFFIKDPKALMSRFGKEVSFMHKREYNLKEGLALFNSFNQGHYAKAFIGFISGRKFRIGDKEEQFNSDDYSWNSGVLALNSCFASYLPDVMKLTDEFYMNSKWFISEQMAFSLILQRKTTIKPADKIILHYWGKRQKILVDQLIGDLLHQYTAAELLKRPLMKSLTKMIKRKVEVDLISEQMEIAFSQGSRMFGLKKILQIIFKRIFG